MTTAAFWFELSSCFFWYWSTRCCAGRDASKERSVSVVHRGSIDFRSAAIVPSKAASSAFISGREARSDSQRGSVFSSVLIWSCSQMICASTIILSASETSSAYLLASCRSLSSARPISASAISNRWMPSSGNDSGTCNDESISSVSSKVIHSSHTWMIFSFRRTDLSISRFSAVRRPLSSSISLISVLRESNSSCVSEIVLSVLSVSEICLRISGT